MRGYNHRGFTLLELLIVLVIAVMATTLIAPGFNQVAERMALRGDSQKIAALLRFARSEAISRASLVRVELHPESGELSVSHANKNTLYPLEAGTVISLTGAGHRPDRQPYILFFPDGSSSGGSVSLKASDSQYQIMVDWLTGRVNVDG
ncbi:GspH/FimT family pseudopilin [Aliamphritea hakodatensis]|uniref:GspH/FimT family pseudopilin n=1 Tax=Aliamphritea hakodatensis TaxID=2895352 RepID=UPI0022FD8BD3|nr:GspH/FimT family pseudopilin [Aliamphritea hakodatensis]